MNSLKGVLEILNPQNKHILLDNDLADLLEIKRRRSRRTINNLMSRHQNNQTVSEVKVNYISICNSNEISNAFNEFSSTIGPKIVREIPLTTDEGSIYLNNIPENCNKFSGFRPTTSVFSWLNQFSDWTSFLCEIPRREYISMKI